MSSTIARPDQIRSTSRRIASSSSVATTPEIFTAVR
jgi:hypothetical protein